MLIAGSAVLGTGGSIFSGIMGAKGAKDQASAIRYAADTASKTALELNNLARADLSHTTKRGRPPRLLARLSGLSGSFGLSVRFSLCGGSS